MGKVYAVKVGRETGLFETWANCEAQVKGFKGAVFQSFKTREQAELWLDETVPTTGYGFADKDKMQIQQAHGVKEKENRAYAWIDGSFNKKMGRYGWGVAIVVDDKLIAQEYGGKHDEEAVKMMNIAGELAAAMRAVCWARKNDFQVYLCHDLQGTADWYYGRFRSKHPLVKKYTEWMHENKEWIAGFIWCKGHEGAKWNEYADGLAKMGSEVKADSKFKMIDIQ